MPSLAGFEEAMQRSELKSAMMEKKQRAHGLNDVRRVEGDVLNTWTPVVVHVFL